MSTALSEITDPKDLLNGIFSYFVNIPHLLTSPNLGSAKLAK